MSEMTTRQLSAHDTEFDKVNEVTTRPGRIDPLTRLVLVQLSGPPSLAAMIIQARHRAAAQIPHLEDSSSAWGGEVQAWIFAGKVTRADEDDIVRMIEDANGMDNAQEIEEDPDLDPDLELGILELLGNS